MNFVAYCRVSTDKDDQLNSLETQKRFFEEYAQKNGLRLLRVYADEGISGTKIKNRKQFLQLMQDSDSGDFQMVAVKDISRLARNAVDFLQCIRELKRKNIACNFVNANLSSQDSEMILGTLALVAQEESANTSKRIKFSKKLNAEKGRVPNLVFGYDKAADNCFCLTINEEEAAVVRRIFALYLSERMGQAKIAALLNSEGCLTKRGCRWSQNAIARILTNPLYTGKIINGKQEITDFLTGKRQHNPREQWLVKEDSALRIIEEEQFSCVQQLLFKMRESSPLREKGGGHLFGTLLKCSCCGYSFRRVERTYQNTYVDWICGGRNAKGKDACENKTVIPEQFLMSRLKSELVDYLRENPAVLRDAQRQAKRCLCMQQNSLTEKQLCDKIEKLRRDRQKYIELHVNNIVTLEELKQKNAQIQSQLCRLEHEANVRKQQPDEVEWLGRDFLDPEELVDMRYVTNAMLKRLIGEITVDQDGRAAVCLNSNRVASWQ